MKPEIYVQFNDIDVEQGTLVATVKKIWQDQGNKLKDIKEMKLYIKPAERKCYYTINDTNGAFDL